MITEDYVSFEIAKLLKEKGFKTPVETGYYGDGRICHNIALDFVDYNHDEGYYSRPTLQMAMKWLREVHGLFIMVWILADKGYWYNVEKIQKESFSHKSLYSSGIANIYYPSYEQDCEAAIKYCLKNLI